MKKNKIVPISIIGLVLVLLSIIAAYIITEKNNFTSIENSQKNIVNDNKTDVKVNKENQSKYVKPREFKGENLIYNDKQIPVLMYHSIADNSNVTNLASKSIILPPEVFREQMQYLKDNGYTTLTLDELYNFLKNNKPVPEKSVVLTFDDAYKDNYTNAYPILKEFGFKATIFVITGGTDKIGAYLTSDQIKEMYANGIDIQSHTVNHEDLDKLSLEKQQETLVQSKQFLEKLLNKKVDFIAYPSGKYNNFTEQAAKNAGYTMAFTINSGWANRDTNIYFLNRVFVNALKDFEQFKERLNNSNYE
ncbi:polysaccharide deacetylase family protein [Clostridium pasteurianum DSM 525 = ATCC 6013]|uniref:Polysaccharide deacetylase n=1 Tax=Clostridium pasteurianum DSM 525 = ATCC 6013 TaxID=1262449 RepID=A0A0H3IYZ8_CLOPA|nr:polysaccharide deacetylase family protein [Clostridium pasteurianum]AJA46254.1 polysaccharide deacetylase family protein [Clostridium pasteurianum DSM 525 = ATCC 6013]AJA50242.1 polysaccharide deacetylase family protein [Clostridium pasteurianum DSM 525 = ATCC 6013]ELP60838.1 polysaccharide deacetylase family protein [Clostridium pasteurianum DSM 525 = ATCC 6013]KRU13745.1 polysaccharide deacetylase [Clostridium pasteurianum DSM 525 = ATCC 6013]UZW14435.1 polysaccharide deacetylase family p